MQLGGPPLGLPGDTPQPQQPVQTDQQEAEKIFLLVLELTIVLTLLILPFGHSVMIMIAITTAARYRAVRFLGP